MEAARTANGVEACGPRGHVGSRLFTCFLCGSGLCEKCGIHTESHGNPVWCCGGCEPVVKSFSRMKSGSIRTQLQALSLDDEVNAVEAKQKERKEEGDDDRSTGTARLKSEAKSDVKPEKSSDEVEAAKMMTLMRSSSGPAPEQRPLYRARRRAQSVGRNSNSDGGDSARVSRFRRSSYNTAFRTGSPSRKRKESPTSSPARSPKRANSPARFSLGPPPSGGAYSDGDVPSGESSPRGSPSRGMTQAGFRRGVRRDISLRHPSFAKGMKTTSPTDSKRRPFFLRNSRVMPPQVGVRFQRQQQQQQQQNSRTVAYASSPAAGSLQFGLRAPPQTVSYAAPHGAPGGVAPAGMVQHRQQPMMTPRPMQYPTSTTVVGEAVGGGGVEPQTFPAPVVVVGKGKNSVYQCPYCARPFSQRCNVIAHIRTHTGEKPFLCVTCNKGFKQRSNLKRHYRSKRHLALVAYAENPSSWGAHVGETGAGGVDAQYAGAQYAGARTPPQQPEGVRVVPRQVAMPQQMYTTDSPRLGASNGPAPARVSHVRQQVPPQVQQQVPPQVQQQPYYGGHLQAPPQHRVVQQQQQQQMQQHQQIQQIQQQQQMQQHQRIQQIQQQQQMQQRQQLQQQRQQHQHHMPQGLQPAAAPPRAPFAAQRPMEGKRAYHAYSLSQ